MLLERKFHQIFLRYYSQGIIYHEFWGKFQNTDFWLGSLFYRDVKNKIVSPFESNWINARGEGSLIILIIYLIKILSSFIFPLLSRSSPQEYFVLSVPLKNKINDILLIQADTHLLPKNEDLENIRGIEDLFDIG